MIDDQLKIPRLNLARRDSRDFPLYSQVSCVRGSGGDCLRARQVRTRRAPLPGPGSGRSAAMPSDLAMGLGAKPGAAARPFGLGTVVPPGQNASWPGGTVSSGQPAASAAHLMRRISLAAYSAAGRAHTGPPIRSGQAAGAYKLVVRQQNYYDTETRVSLNP
jgi:hypothetical protein